jgi:Spy/CpxP family protein refolding chaperone
MLNISTIYFYLKLYWTAVILNNKSMKQLNFKTAALLLVVSLMLFGTEIYGQRGQGKGTASANSSQGNICRNIPDLTADQMKNIDRLRSEHQEKMARLRLDMAKANVHMQELRLDGADTSNINKVIDEKSHILANMQKERLAHFSEINKLLNDEQKAWLNNNSRRGKGFGSGQGRGCGLGREMGYGAGKGRNFNL